MVVEIKRKYVVGQNKAIIGQDSFGATYAKCVDCNKNMAVLIDIDRCKRMELLKRKAVCTKCGNMVLL